MTSIDTSPSPSGAGGGKILKTLLEILGWVGNFILALIVFVIALAGLGTLVGTWGVSASQDSGIFDISGWMLVLGLVAAACLYEFGRNIRNVLEDLFKVEEVPIWRFTISTALAGIVMFLGAWCVHQVPLNLDVDRGEFRVLNDGHGTVMTSGTLQGSRLYTMSRTYPLSASVQNGAIGISLNNEEWVSVGMTYSYVIEMTPELRAIIAENPPAIDNTLAHPENYFDNLVMSLVSEQIAQMIREEGQPGATATGDYGAWPHTGSSVPMSVRLGLRLEERRATLPSWLKRLEIQNVSVGTWHHRQQDE